MSDIEKVTPNAVQTEADKRQVKISESRGRRDRVSNRMLMWGRFCERLSHPVRDTLTRKQFLALPEKEQQDRKNQGYFVGGHFKDGVRKIEALELRSVVTMDIDECSVALASELVEPIDGWLSDFDYVTYSTRSHTPAHPRLRVVIILSREVTPDEYVAVSRILASKIDADMLTVDPVSFRPAQVMFFPSVSRGEEYLFHRNRGQIVDPDALFAEFGASGDDLSKLPVSPRETKLRQSSKKATDPRTKRGWVGAFCRTYDIEGAIEKYLSDIYVPGEDGRYTYVKGSSTNGLVLYDDGTQAYSHHGSDPTGGRLSNSFDLTALNLYGHLDKTGADTEDDNPTSKPSYKAMVELLQQDDDVVREYSKGLYDYEAMENDAVWDEDLEDDDREVTPGAITEEVKAPPPKEKPPAKAEKPGKDKAASAAGPDWMDNLDRNDKGAVKNTLHNVILILENDPRFKNALAYNELLEEVVIVRRIHSAQYGHDTGPVRNKENGDMIGGAMRPVIRAILEGPRGEDKTGWGLKVSERDLVEAIDRVAYSHSFHPIQRYLRAVQWDGVPRIGKLLHTYWHARDSHYHSEVGRLFLVACIARVFEAGHKFDFVMILEGKQGIRKSTSFAALVGQQWFAEFTADIEKKNDVVENLVGKWLVEMAELVAFLKGDNEVLKSLFSAQSTRTRLAYGRGAKDYPRRNVFVGTTNEDEYFKDRTGNRRYWVVKLADRAIDTDAIARDRDQLWAEAYQTYLWMRRAQPDLSMPLFLDLDREAKREAERLQGSRMVSDVDSMFTGQIHEWLETPVPVGQHKAGWRPSEDGDDEPAGQELLLRQTVCVRDVLALCLYMDERRLDQRTIRMIGNALSTARGWEKREGSIRLGRRLGKQKVWLRSTDL